MTPEAMARRIRALEEWLKEVAARVTGLEDNEE